MQLKSLTFESKAVNTEKRTFEGYASTFDLDQGGDLITKGAFTKTLQEAGSRVKVLWQHHEPIGRPLEMEEDEKGLFVKAKISKTRLGDEALELMKDRVIDRMSIGYRIPEGKSEYNSDGIRVIRELKLLEFSLVTFPMNEAAIITDVKRMRDQLSIGHRFNDADLKYFRELAEDLNALLGKEPSVRTPTPGQPHEKAMADLLADVKSFKLEG